MEGTSSGDAENEVKEGEDTYVEHRSLVRGYSKNGFDLFSKRSYSARAKQMSRSRSKEIILRRTQILEGWIPSQMVTVDEKYMRKCLELMHIDGSNGASCTISYNLGWDSPSHDPNFVVNSSGKWIVGTIMESRTMKALINTPLFSHYSLQNGLKKLTLNDVSSGVSSPSRISGRSIGYHKAAKPPKLSAASLASPASPSTSNTRGMLQCVWKDNEPHFVFSLDDTKVVYVASMSKSSLLNHPSVDYVYLIYAGTTTRRIAGSESKAQLVGKMTVSSSLALCSDHLTILDREFVLFADIESGHGNLNHANRKLKTVSKKAFDASGEIGIDLAEGNLPSNFELGAIVVRDCFPSNQNHGGWGLKFLKNTEADKHSSSSSSAVHVILPAGIHGGPRSKNGGPFSLVERWRSGGCCDCGGWDVGCPLTLLDDKPNGQENSTLCELFIQGSQDSSPAMRVAVVHDGLFLVNFESSLSALQAFSIVVARVHAQSSLLRPNMYRC